MAKPQLVEEDGLITVPYHLWLTGWPLGVGGAVALLSVLMRFDRLGIYRAMLKVAYGFRAFGALLLTILVFIPFLGEAIPAFVQWLIEVVPGEGDATKGESRRILLIASALGAGSLGPLAGRFLTKHSSKVAGVAVSFVFPLAVIVTLVLFVRAATVDAAAGDESMSWWGLGIVVLAASTQPRM